MPTLAPCLGDIRQSLSQMRPRFPPAPRSLFQVRAHPRQVAERPRVNEDNLSKVIVKGMSRALVGL